MDYTMDQLTAVGGVLWEKNGFRRVYFNDLPALIGLDYARYKTGNIKSATLRGEGISNGQATRILNQLHQAKFWYDLGDSTFHGRDCGDHFADLISAVKARIDS